MCFDAFSIKGSGGGIEVKQGHRTCVLMHSPKDVAY